VPGTAYDTDRVWTVPNVLSLARLAGVPLFLWLVLGPHADGWAVVVLMVGGATDFLDGYLARSRHQISRIGQMLDPIVDRTYIAATLLGLGLREIIPWWLVAVLVARDVCMFLLVPILRTRGYTSLPVHFVGKAATFFLLYAFPAVLLGDGDWPGASVCKVVGWAFVIWGSPLYWWAGLLYIRQTIAIVHATRQIP
jgi:cardiolipin synthase (CMP-forming)